MKEITNKVFLKDCDADNNDFYPAKLIDKISNKDICESQDMCISVQYNEIDMGRTKYGFDQPFENDEANVYFQKMKEFSDKSINEIMENSDYTKHFHKSRIEGNLSKVLKSINHKIIDANPLIFHFALYDDKPKHQADRSKGIRNPRIYFMMGKEGMIHILFFDPYHEINP